MFQKPTLRNEPGVDLLWNQWSLHSMPPNPGGGPKCFVISHCLKNWGLLYEKKVLENNINNII